MQREIEKVGAPVAEVKAALAFATALNFDPHAYDALSPTARRLVDLFAVADDMIALPIAPPTQPTAGAAQWPTGGIGKATVDKAVATIEGGETALASG